MEGTSSHHGNPPEKKLTSVNVFNYDFQRKRSGQMHQGNPPTREALKDSEVCQGGFSVENSQKLHIVEIYQRKKIFFYY